MFVKIKSFIVFLYLGDILVSSCADSWDCGDFQGEDGLDDGRKEPLAKAMLLTGPSGVGKTAVVYACAQELGFKVGI